MHPASRSPDGSSQPPDSLAVGELLQRHLPGLVAFIRLRAGPLVRARESAADLAQSVCREALEDPGRFRHGGEAGFKSWLYATALRRIQNRHDYWKAGKRDAARDVPLAPHPDASGQQDLLACYRTLSTPSRKLMLAEEIARIESAFDQLDEADREIILLARVAGLPHDEIARRLGKTAGATRVRLHRALARLAMQLEE